MFKARLLWCICENIGQILQMEATLICQTYGRAQVHAQARLNSHLMHFTPWGCEICVAVCFVIVSNYY